MTYTTPSGHTISTLEIPRIKECGGPWIMRRLWHIVIVFLASLVGLLCDWLLEIATWMLDSREYSHLSWEFFMEVQQPVVKFYNHVFEDCDLDGSLVMAFMNTILGP